MGNKPVKLFWIWISGSGGIAIQRYFLSGYLAALLFSIIMKCYHLCNSVRGYYEEQFCEIILNLGQWFRSRCCLKDFLSGALAKFLFGGAEPFIQFWKRASWGTFMWSYVKNLDQWFRRCCLKTFLIWSSGGPFIMRSRTIIAILLEGIKRNNSVKLFWIWTSVSWDAFKDISYLGLWQPLYSAEWTHLCNFGRRHHEEQFCEKFWIWTSGSGGEVV